MTEYYSFKASNGVMRIDLGHQWKRVCLFDITLPHIRGKVYEIDLTCDQVDKSVENPTRLLRRICVTSSARRCLSFTHLIWRIIDSSDRFLTIRMPNFQEETIDINDVYITIGLSDTL